MTEQEIEKMLGRKMDSLEGLLYEAYKDNKLYKFIKDNGALRLELI